MTRFVVLETWGYLTARTGFYSSMGEPGVSATVYDELLDRTIHTYRSEDERGKRDSRGRAIRTARQHAARLEAEYGG